MNIENLNKYKNQFLITDKNKTTFQSYNSKIAEFNFKTNILKLYEDWDYSKTTLRYFKSFINEYTPFTYVNKAQWEKEIKEDNKIVRL